MPWKGTILFHLEEGAKPLDSLQVLVVTPTSSVRTKWVTLDYTQILFLSFEGIADTGLEPVYTPYEGVVEPLQLNLRYKSP